MKKCSTLERLKAKLLQAQRAMIAELKRQYPEGSSVFVFLSYRQKESTPAVVVGHDSCGIVSVLLDTAKEGSRRPCRNVYFNNVSHNKMWR